MIKSAEPLAGSMLPERSAQRAYEVIEVADNRSVSVSGTWHGQVIGGADEQTRPRVTRWNAGTAYARTTGRGRAVRIIAARGRLAAVRR